MSTKHTPGPWRVAGRVHPGSKRVTVVSDEAFQEVAETMDWDAALIAAAPELLAALRCATETCGHGDVAECVDFRALLARVDGGGK